MRRSVRLLWVISIVVNIGMWLERYVIVVTSLHRDYLPSSWSMYHGTVWDYATFYGTLGLFLSLIFLFIRFLPVISITEMRELVYESQAEHGHARRAEPGRRRQRHEDGNAAPAVYGLLAEFDKPEDVVAATRDAYAHGYRFMEAYTPFPVEGLAEALGFHRNGIADCFDRRGDAAASAAFSCCGTRPSCIFRWTSAGGPTIVGRRSSRSRSS